MNGQQFKQQAGGSKTNGTRVTMNSWLGFTLSGLIGFGAALVTVTMTFSATSHEAGAALQRAKDNAKDIDDDIRLRLRALEEWRAESREQYKTIIKALDRVEAKIDKDK